MPNPTKAGNDPSRFDRTGLRRAVPRRNRTCALVLAAGCLIAAGCGGPYKTYPVEGTVMLADGTPLADVRVTFVCEEPAVSATGVTDDQGHFVLGTAEVDDGAPAGAYRVVIVEAAHADLPPPPRIHARYARMETSGLQFTVEPQRNEFALQLDPAGR